MLTFLKRKITFINLCAILQLKKVLIGVMLFFFMSGQMALAQPTVPSSAANSPEADPEAVVLMEITKIMTAIVVLHSAFIRLTYSKRYMK
ncbi:MAG: hypothetical protein AWM53_01576 [Candidatus Dichloromethanomonas elyunquensis]|nr:MAG: hypothetical protein AWM53_01576 [Candidatus Dichloromethanomonas elyunquensis]